VREHVDSCRCSGLPRGVLQAAERVPSLAGLVGWDGLFAPLLEIVGEDEGTRLLREALHKEIDEPADAFREA